MKAALIHAFGVPPEITQVADPAPPDDGVVLEVEANGVCRSDWHAWMGHDPDVQLPHVPGHEMVGQVVAVGKQVHDWHPGDRVTAPFACGCGRCQPCRQGHTHICAHQVQPGFTHWGAFARYVAIHHAAVNLVALPEHIHAVAAASLGCRFMTAFWAVTEQGRLTPGEWLAVHGCGGLGLAAVMIGHALGGRVIAVDIDDEKLSLARELGAEHILNAHHTDPVTAIRELSGDGCGVSLDALGSPTTCANSIQCLARRGRHVQVGLLLGEAANPPLPMDRVIARELQILGSHGMPVYRYPALLSLIEAGRLAPQRLVSRTVDLAGGVEAMMAMGHYATTGVVVVDDFS